MLESEALTGSALGAAIRVHRFLGPGLLESAYQASLHHELLLRGHRVSSQVPVRVNYRGMELDCAYVLDLLVDDALVIEIKSVEALLPVHEAQLMTYLRLTGKRVGLLINFNVPVLRDGVRRRVLGPIAGSSGAAR